MIRTKLQEGPDRSHYHDRLGVTQDQPGEQTIRLLGPFRVDFDTAGITSSNGVVAFNLDPDQVLLRPRCEVVTLWDADPDNAQIVMAVGGAQHGDEDVYDCAKWLVGSNVAPTRDANNAPEAPMILAAIGSIIADTAVGTNMSPRVVTAGAIRVRATGVVGATAGAVDIYALIAAPA